MVYERHVYQSSLGGKTYVPADKEARLVGKTSPRLAKIIGYNYANMSSLEVQGSLKLSHDLWLNVSMIQDISSLLASICIEKQSDYSYELSPELVKQTTTIAISRDGTTTRIKGQGYRETMCGSLTCYDKDGNRLHSAYIGQAPQHGKHQFNAQLSNEIQALSSQIPKAVCIGLADGASDGWTFLADKSSVQILDYFHACGYLSHFAKAYFKEPSEEKKFFNEYKEILKNSDTGAKKVLSKFKKLLKKNEPTLPTKELCNKSITYFSNNLHRMNYAQYQQKGYPIGSGIIEAACKTLIKQRLSRSGMIWTIKGVDDVLAIRQLVKSDNRWNLFWYKIDQNGF